MIAASATSKSWKKKALAQSVLISSQAFEGAYYYSGKAAGKA
jgi:hypothetical protein